MSKARLVITAVTVEKRPAAQVAAEYGVSRSWIYELLARYRAEGETAFVPRSRAPHASPQATPPQTVQLVVELRKKLAEAGLDAGADTIGWHLHHHHRTVLSRSTINRILTRAGAVVPEPAKRPRSSYIRFEAEQPNETWQSDFTHYRLTRPDGTPGTDTEIITWLDDHSRYALHISAHHRITGPIVHTTFTETVARHGYPASTLTDNGMVYTTRFAGGKGGRSKLEAELRRRNIRQKNSRPNHPTTCGKVERFQQTMKNWLRAQPHQPATINQLQALLEQFQDEYNQRRPHRSLPTGPPPRPSTPPARKRSRPPTAPPTPMTGSAPTRPTTPASSPCASPAASATSASGRPHARTHVLLLVHDHHVRIVNAATGELLRELTINPTRDYQPRSPPPSPHP